jgi:hypothetical protein
MLFVFSGITHKVLDTLQRFVGHWVRFPLAGFSAGKKA